MGTVPTNRLERLAFYEEHIPLWTTNAASVGLSVGDVGAMAALITAGRDGVTAQSAAKLASKNATIDANNALDTMGTLGAALMLKIRAYAESTNNTGVFALAGLPLPTPPSPLPAPGVCEQFVVSLLPTGAVQLKWKCQNPPGASGTVYEIRRGPSASGPWTFIGAAGGDRTFIDDTLARGTDLAVYQVFGRRSGLSGTPTTVNVVFGVTGGGGGFAVTSVSEVVGTKLAA